MTTEEREALIAQGWTPPVAVDPDEKWARAYTKELFDHRHTVNPGMAYDYFLGAIKQGRELERAEAKPGMVWVKHDGSTICPVDRDIWVLTKTFGYNPCVNRGKRLAWQSVSFYCVITPPEDK
jgi:hypothetical protein